jgi:adenylyltransferase/sulfurtransferase
MQYVTHSLERALFSEAERARYARHFLLPEVGEAGQLALKRARVLLVGLGGLGSPAAQYLAAAGVGRLGLVDFDVVDPSNLQRQILYGARDAGRRKTEAARDRLADLNSHVEIVCHDTRFSSANALELVRAYDVVVDGTDNFTARYLVNDACVLANKPNVHGAIYRFEGQASVFWAARGACYRCLHPEPPPPGVVPSCAEAGVLGVLPGMIGAIQAAETMKLILGIGSPLVNRLLLVDALSMSIREMRLRKDPRCPICGEQPSIRDVREVAAPCESARAIDEMEPVELKRRLDRGEPLNVLDVREPHERAIARLPHTHAIPMGSCVERMRELDPARPTVVFCRSGGRSARVIQALRAAGFTGALFNLKGGTLAWSDTVDPRVPKY